MYGKHGLILLIFSLTLFLIPCVLAIETTQQCLNSTHLEVITKFTFCDSTCTDYNLTQEVNCTNGCDSTVNQCKYIRKSEMGDVAAIISLTFTTGMFFILGMVVNPGKDFTMFKSGLQVLFFCLGLWLLTLDVAMAETIAVSSGASSNTLSLISQTITVVTYGIYIVIFLMLASFVVTVLWMMIPRK